MSTFGNRKRDRGRQARRRRGRERVQASVIHFRVERRVTPSRSVVGARGRRSTLSRGRSHQFSGPQPTKTARGSSRRSRQRRGLRVAARRLGGSAGRVPHAQVRILLRELLDLRQRLGVLQEREAFSALRIAASTCSLESCRACRARACRSIIERRTGSPERVAELGEGDRRVPAHVGDGVLERAPAAAGSRADRRAARARTPPSCARRRPRTATTRAPSSSAGAGRRSAERPERVETGLGSGSFAAAWRAGTAARLAEAARGRARGSAARGTSSGACRDSPSKIRSVSRPRARRAPRAGGSASERDSSKAACQRWLAAPPRTSWR